MREEPTIQHPCGRLLAGPGWGRSRESSLGLRDHELWFVWRGAGWMQTHAGRFDLRPGFCAWMRPGGTYDAGLGDGQPLGFTYIHFTCSHPSPPEFFRVRDVGYFDAVTRRIVEMVERVPESQWGRPARVEPATTALLHAVLLDLLGRPGLAQGQGEGPTPAHREAIEAMAAALRDAPERRVEVGELAAQLGVTPPHFSRLFRSIVGVSPQQHVLRARLDRARHLLVESNLSVTRIAEQLGYRDVFFFSKQFTRHAGVSPTAYRRSAGGPG